MSPGRTNLLSQFLMGLIRQHEGFILSRESLSTPQSQLRAVTIAEAGTRQGHRRRKFRLLAAVTSPAVAQAQGLLQAFKKACRSSQQDFLKACASARACTTEGR